jgi:Tol biopolymer transport system component/tRNA A-37 threonylcarbamoyl transferase component Bud32
VSSAAEPDGAGERTVERWRSIARLFTAALDRPPSERTAFLETAAVDPTVRREVESLLQAHEGLGPFDRMAAGMASIRERALADSTQHQAGDAGRAAPDRRPSLEPGTRLGRYEIGVRLGAGGMGEVYRAFDTRLQRDVAIKVVAQRIRRRPHALERLEQEARAASALNHPNIITVFDIGEDAASPYIVMELIEGDSLRRALSTPLPVESLLDLADQMASGLAVAHERQIVHRDLKPENVVVSRTGTLKILDFGLAQLHGALEPVADSGATLAERLTQQGALLGTLGYMSPELISKEPVDFRSDQFSFGAILYEMATGRRAFGGQTPAETLALTLGSEPASLAAERPDLPPKFIAVVERCLGKSARDRYATTRDLLDDLRNARRGRGRPRGRVAAALAASLLVAAIVAGIAVWRSRVGRSSAVPVRLVPLTHDEGNDAAPSFAPDGRRFVFSSDRSGNWDLWVGEIAGGHPLRITDSAEVEDQPAWSPDGTRMAFVRRRLNDSTPDVFVMPAGGGTARRLAERAIDPAWSEDGRFIAFAEFAGGWVRIAKVPVDGGKSAVGVTEVEMDHYHRRPAWTPDGRTLVFNRSRGGYVGQIVRVASSGGRVEPVTRDPPGTANIEATVTPDGRHVVHVSDRGGAMNLWRVPILGGTPERITSGPGRDLAPDVSSDGKRIAFVSSPQAYSLLEVSLATGASATLGSFEDSEAWGPALSPDGSLVAFSQKVSGRPWQLVLIPAGGGAPRPILEGLPDVFGLRFLPDGSALVFDTRRSRGGRIGTVRTDGTGLVWITPEEEDATHPDVSPDARLLAYVRAHGSVVEIVTRPFEGGEPRVVVTGATLPGFSPDGRRLVFARSRSYNGGVGVVDLLEGRVRQLTTSGSWPVWMPDGRTVAFADGSPEGTQTAWAVDAQGGPPRPLVDFRWHGPTFPFLFSRDGSRLITTDNVSKKSTIWLAEF